MTAAHLLIVLSVVVVCAVAIWSARDGYKAGRR